MPCLEDGDQSLSLAAKDFEPDEDVFESESESGSDSELEDMKRLGTQKESLKRSGQSMFSNARPQR